MFAWVVCNIAIIACFTGLAIHFDKWWIVLFAMLFTYNYKSQKDDALKEEQYENARQDQAGA